MKLDWKSIGFTALVVVGTLIVWKNLVQKFVPTSAQAYLPAV